VSFRFGLPMTVCPRRSERPRPGSNLKLAGLDTGSACLRTQRLAAIASNVVNRAGLQPASSGLKDQLREALHYGSFELARYTGFEPVASC
jgi:hypothetical protein